MPIFNLEEFKTKRFEVLNKAESKTSEIFLYGNIGSEYNGVDLKLFNQMLKEIPASAKEVSIRINSPGGDVFQGVAMHTRLKSLKQKKKVYIDGVAASIASVIALAGDEVVISEAGMMMIHKPWTFAMGNGDELMKTVDLLDKIESQMIGLYAKKTKMSAVEIANLMKEDFWMTSKEAIEYGFADSEIEASAQLKVAASLVKDAKWLKNAPEIKASVLEVQSKIGDIRKEIENFQSRFNAQK